MFNNEDIDAYEGANLCRSFINSLIKPDLEHVCLARKE